MKTAVFLLIIAALCYPAASQHARCANERSATLGSDERLRLVLSKIAPLENWSSSMSDFGPKICWKLFRPNPKLSEELVRVINNFQGHTKWTLTAGDCLEPLGGRTLHPSSSGGIIMPTPAVERPILNADQASDLLQLAETIEENLHLASVQPQLFSESFLTKEVLARTPGPFEDFDDAGERTVYFITETRTEQIFEPKEQDIRLHFAPLDGEHTAILGTIVGRDLTEQYGRVLTRTEKEEIKTRFPILYEVSDYYESSYLSPEQAGLLYQESDTLAKTTSSSKALRGLDKLMRMAHWASQKGYGILFLAP